MSPYSALTFAAHEILSWNESLPVVMLESPDGVYVMAWTQGDYVSFKADLRNVGDIDKFSEKLRHVAAILTADEFSPIPDVSGVASSVRVWMDGRLRPNAAPVFNGHDCTVWPELIGYRH